MSEDGTVVRQAWTIMTPDLRRELVAAVLREDDWETGYRVDALDHVYAIELGDVVPAPSDEERAVAEDLVTEDGLPELEARWPVWSLIEYFDAAPWRRSTIERLSDTVAGRRELDRLTEEAEDDERSDGE